MFDRTFASPCLKIEPLAPYRHIAWAVSLNIGPAVNEARDLIFG